MIVNGLRSVRRFHQHFQIKMMSSKAIVGAPQGFAAVGFEPVLHVFEDGIKEGFDKGGALSIYYKGELVVNAWGGLADEPIKRRWTEETLGHFWSGTKFTSSVVIAHLVERGLLGYEEKVSKYWPEFAQNGKEKITLNSLLSHSAGLSLTKESYQLSWMIDQPRYFSDFLASQTPLWEPGTKHGYSGFLVGVYLNEIVKRVDVKGRSLSQYFHEEIATPFGIDFHIGLPKSLYYRACRAAWREITEEEMMKAMENFEGDMDLFLLMRTQPSDIDLKTSLDDPDFASLPCGSSHGVGTAKAAAKFAGIIGNGGFHEGNTLLTKKSIEQLQVPLTSGIDCVLSEPLTFGRGTILFPAKQEDKTWFVFGHLGYGGQVILSDRQYKMGFAYCTNYMEPFANFDNNRYRHVLETFYRCVSKIEGHSGEVKLYEKYKEFLKDTNKSKM